MATEQPTYQDRISSDPKVMAGKPVVRGTRMPVEIVLRALAQNPNVQELFVEYPRLTMDDVRACLAYAEALVAGEEVTPAPKHQRSAAYPSEAPPAIRREERGSASADAEDGVPNGAARGQPTRSRRGRRVLSADDPMFDLVGIGHSDGPGDVSANKHRYLAEASHVDGRRSPKT
ncbi:MAG: DUF433 domain-containing protein [Dehalococcoidia bacterium]